MPLPEGSAGGAIAPAAFRKLPLANEAAPLLAPSGSITYVMPVGAELV